MARRSLLTAEEVCELDDVFLSHYAHVAELRTGREVARHLHAPKLPSILTESITALAADVIWGEGALASNGGRRGDLVVETVGRARDIVVAVKGTGPCRWITVTPSDLQADALVWVDYSERLQSLQGPVFLEVFASPPRKWINRPGRSTFAGLDQAFPRSARRRLPVEVKDLVPRPALAARRKRG
jgi:hypothetical protein